MRSLGLLVAGAALLAFGQGHSPLGPVAVAGLALVAAAFRSGRGWIVAPAFVVLHVAACEHAYRGMVPLGTGARLGMQAGVALALAGVLLTDAAVARRTRAWPATLVLPCGWVAFDLLSARLSPGGTWGSLAYSFVEPLALAQVASLVGWTGLTFLAAWTASVAAGLLGPEPRRARLPLGAVVAVLVATALFGAVRLAGGEPGPVLSAANLVAPSTYGVTDESVDDVWAYTRGVDAGPESRERALARLEASLEEHLALADRALAEGARLVVFAEANASVTTAERPGWIARAGGVARERGGWIGLGLVTFDPGEVLTSRNELVVVGPDGELAFDFLKITRPPGARHEVGEWPLPTRPLGEADVSAAICFDLDFPHLLRPVGRSGADLLIAPSNDWEEAAATHARMARLRAIEQGCAVLRPTKDGVSFACDRAGRVLASQDTLSTANDESARLAVDVPLVGAPTLYARIGDAFAWLCAAGFAGALVWLARSRRAAAGA